MNKSEQFVVMRKHSLPEDEGHDEVIGTHPTLEEARAWIDAQEESYFQRSDYYIKEEPRDTK